MEGKVIGAVFGFTDEFLEANKDTIVFMNSHEEDEFVKYQTLKCTPSALYLSTHRLFLTCVKYLDDFAELIEDMVGEYTFKEQPIPAKNMFYCDNNNRYYFGSWMYYMPNAELADDNGEFIFDKMKHFITNELEKNINADIATDGGYDMIKVIPV